VPAKRRLAKPGPHDRRHKPALTTSMIVAWAEAFFQKHGQWPYPQSGPVAGAPGETWLNIDYALRHGTRGLSRRLSIARLLRAAKGVRVRAGRPAFTVPQILAWADAFFKAHRVWPRPDSGPVAGAPGESWKKINAALCYGTRGLRGKSSLLGLLQKHRGVLRGADRFPWATKSRLSMKEIRAWAKEHRRRTGAWSHVAAGRVPSVAGLTWAKIDVALRVGCRGLPGGSSLARLFGRKPHRRRQ